jgi:hypothetical protein
MEARCWPAKRERAARAAPRPPPSPRRHSASERATRGRDPRRPRARLDRLGGALPRVATPPSAIRHRDSLCAATEPARLQVLVVRGWFVSLRRGADCELLGGAPVETSLSAQVLERGPWCAGRRQQCRSWRQRWRHWETPPNPAMPDALSEHQGPRPRRQPRLAAGLGGPGILRSLPWCWPSPAPINARRTMIFWQTSKPRETAHPWIRGERGVPR